MQDSVYHMNDWNSFYCVKSGFAAFKVEIIWMEKLTLLQNAFWRYAPITKGYLKCGLTNNMTCRYEYRITVTSTPTGKWFNMSNYKNSIFLFIIWRRCYSVANVMS